MSTCEAAAKRDKVNDFFFANGCPRRAMQTKRSSKARLFQELTHGLNAGVVVWEGGHPLWRGETDLQTVLSMLLGKR